MALLRSMFFFVLSGYVIAWSADKSNSSFVNTIISRVLRLAIPSAISKIMAAALFNLSISNVTASADLVNHWWIKNLLTYDKGVGWGSTLQEAAGTFFWSGQSVNNAVLWTMQRELVGSVAIYALFTMKTGLFRLVACVAVFYLTVIANFDPWYYICFLNGVLIYFARDIISILSPRVSTPLIVIGVFLGGKPFFPPPGESVYYWPYAASSYLGLSMYVWPLGATFLLAGSISSETFRLLLLKKPFVFLGRISFSLYLVHFPLMLVFMTNWFVKYGFWPASFLYMILMFVLAFAFTVFVDEPTVALCRRLRGRPRLASIAAAPGS
ncbi:acyltransferase family protein [Salinarimonas soli]|uniref:Acyltransferase n=1 Tax=Salinarimonas soli TaxID=1638099 RepID=A0A5B2VAM4_9HYPH|nr:acyltransferase [Salinarimonas soli]KAA2235257.1 acyltransferase [Salinarimonas soli]